MDTNQIVVTDDQGNEQTLEVLFTFNSDETGKKYVLYYNPEDEQPSVFASIFDDEGNLFEIETPEEWEMVEEVFHSFQSENEEAGEGHACCQGEDHECGCSDEGGCGHDHGEDHGCGCGNH